MFYLLFKKIPQPVAYYHYSPKKKNKKNSIGRFFKTTYEFSWQISVYFPKEFKYYNFLITLEPTYAT